MKKIVSLWLFGLQSLFWGQAYASDYLGKVSVIHVRDADGLIWVYIEGTRTGERPTCADKEYLVIKNENSPAGQRQLALLMMAQASDKTVFIEGARTCTRWGDGEDINMLSIRK